MNQAHGNQVLPETSTRKTHPAAAPVPRFNKTYCSQCGQEFGPGDHGYSHCIDHAHLKGLDDGN